MTPWVWIGIVVFHLITILWYFLIRRDILSYLHTQIKLVGKENAHRIDNVRFRFLLWLYAFVLLFLMGGMTFYLYTYA